MIDILHNVYKIYPWIEERTILLSKSGSFSYGTNTEESDEDYRGICIPPKEYFLGIDLFNEYNNTGGKNFKSNKNSIDISIAHLNKFVCDALSGVPNNIEILFFDRSNFLKIDEYGEELIKIRHEFLSNNIFNKFFGYSTSMYRKLMNPNKVRTNLVDQFGYDVKFAMHAVRLLSSGIEILTTGNIVFPLKNRELLLDILKGKYSFGDMLKMINHYQSETLNISLNKISILPDKPRYDFINKWLCDLNFKRLSE